MWPDVVLLQINVHKSKQILFGNLHPNELLAELQVHICFLSIFPASITQKLRVIIALFCNLLLVVSNCFITLKFEDRSQFELNALEPRMSETEIKKKEEKTQFERIDFQTHVLTSGNWYCKEAIFRALFEICRLQITKLRITNTQYQLSFGDHYMPECPILKSIYAQKITFNQQAIFAAEK